MAVRIVRLGAPRLPDEGLRIGTVRRPPRGVPKSEFAARDFYDVWLPQLAPSLEVMAQVRSASSSAEFDRAINLYRKEMAVPDNSHLLEVLAALSKSTNFSVGCYCENESHCHRSVLRQLLQDRGADFH